MLSVRCDAGTGFHKPDIKFAFVINSRVFSLREEKSSGDIFVINVIRCFFTMDAVHPIFITSTHASKVSTKREESSSNLCPLLHARKGEGKIEGRKWEPRLMGSICSKSEQRICG